MITGRVVDKETSAGGACEQAGDGDADGPVCGELEQGGAVAVREARPEAVIADLLRMGCGRGWKPVGEGDVPDQRDLHVRRMDHSRPALPDPQRVSGPR